MFVVYWCNAAVLQVWPEKVKVPAPPLVISTTVTIFDQQLLFTPACNSWHNACIGDMSLFTIELFIVRFYTSSMIVLPKLHST